MLWLPSCVTFPTNRRWCRWCGRQIPLHISTGNWISMVLDKNKNPTIMAHQADEASDWVCGNLIKFNSTMIGRMLHCSSICCTAFKTHFYLSFGFCFLHTSSPQQLCFKNWNLCHEITYCHACMFGCLHHLFQLHYSTCVTTPEFSLAFVCFQCFFFLFLTYFLLLAYFVQHVFLFLFFIYLRSIICSFETKLNCFVSL